MTSTVERYILLSNRARVKFFTKIQQRNLFTGFMIEDRG